MTANYEIGQPVQAALGGVMLDMRNDSLRVTLEYSGMWESTILLSHREFVCAGPSHIAVSAIERLQYDLAASDTIVFRNVRMHISEATNSQIHFTVIEDAGLVGLQAVLPNRLCGPETRGEVLNPIVEVVTNYVIGEPAQVDTGGFMLKMRVNYVENSFWSALKYKGLSGARLQLFHEEYIIVGHDVLLGVGRVDLEHDLAESDTVVLRTVKMHVHEATDTHIRFTVIEDGGLPWLRVGLDEHTKRGLRR